MYNVLRQIVFNKQFQWLSGKIDASKEEKGESNQSPLQSEAIVLQDTKLEKTENGLMASSISNGTAKVIRICLAMKLLWH